MTWKRINWRSVFFIVLLPIATLITVCWYFLNYGLSLDVAVLSVFYYYATGMSITGGYHRLFSHRTYEASLPIRIFYLFFGAGAFQDSVLTWCADHRYHHNYTDTDRDPYNPKRGFWFSHMGWMLSHDTPVEEKKARMMTRDLREDPWVMFQHRYYVWIAVFSGFVMPALIGWALGKPFEAFLFAGLLRTALVHQYTFFINSLAHIWGKQTYGTRYTAKDNGFLSLFTYGEGYHNFHHHFQNDYRNGVKWYCYDPTKWMIQVFSLLGLVDNLKKTHEHEIILAKIHEESRRLDWRKIRLIEPLDEKFLQLQVHIDACAIKLRKVQEEYNELARSLKDKKDHRLALMKIEMQTMRREMRLSYRQWKKMMSLSLRARPQSI